MDHFSIALPIMVLWGTSSLMLAFHLKSADAGSQRNTRLGAGGLLLSLFCLCLIWPATSKGMTTFHGMLLLDGLGAVTSALVILAGLATLIFARDYFRKTDQRTPEIPTLILLSVAGMVAMATSNSLPVIFLGLEIMSLSLYVLSAGLRRRQRSIEAGTKYYLTGVFASGIFLMGVALIYGATGRLSLPEIGPHLSSGDPLALAGLLLLLVGFGFKLSAVPFHQWTPDVYEGAPTPITGFMSTAVKLVAFTALLRVLARVGALDSAVHHTVGWLAAATMLVGTLGALAQKSVKRMLAYSSISHGGYLLLGAAALGTLPKAASSPTPAEAILFYLLAYTIMNLGAFGVLALIETRQGKGLEYADLAGLKERHPYLAGSMLIFMLSLAGVPPTAGFLAKWKLFQLLADRMQGADGGFFIFLVALLIVSSLISLAYYLRVVVAMYMTPSPREAPIFPRPARWSAALVLLGALLILWLGIGPENMLTWVAQVR